jgi:hypothetical protein
MYLYDIDRAGSAPKISTDVILHLKRQDFAFKDLRRYNGVQASTLGLRVRCVDVLSTEMALFASLSMAYACVLLHFIYTRAPASINVWIQTPGYVFGALSEIWAIVTGIEIAHNNSLENLRAVVTSVF